MSVEIPRPIAERLRGLCRSIDGNIGQSVSESVRAMVQEGRDLGNILNESLSLDARDTRPDFEAMLGEVLEAVQLQGGRLALAIPTRRGVDAALVALSELAPVLAPSPGDTQALTQMLREAVRVQTPVYRMVIKEHTSSWSNESHVETGVIEAQPCACGLPREREEVVLEDGRRGRVLSVSHVGASAVVTVLLSGQIQAEEA